MSEAELDARIEIAREFLHDFISRPTHLKMFGAQDSDEWLRLSGFFAEGAIIPDPKHNQWRAALGMEPIPKEYRYFHGGELLPIGVRTMNDVQFAEYVKALKRS